MLLEGQGCWVTSPSKFTDMFSVADVFRLLLLVE